MKNHFQKQVRLGVSNPKGIFRRYRRFREIFLMPQGEEQREVLRKKQKSESLLVRKKSVGMLQRYKGKMGQPWRIRKSWIILASYLTLWQSQSQQTLDRIHVSAVQFLIQRKWDASVDIWIAVMLLNFEMSGVKSYASVVAGEEQVGGITTEKKKTWGEQ